MTTAESNNKIVFRSPFPDVSVEDVSVTQIVLRRAVELADKPAFIDAVSGTVLTYGALATSVRRLAGGLIARGFAKGDVLALMAPNCLEYAVIFHGVAMAGGVITTINPSYTEREVHHQLIDAGAKFLIAVPACLAVASAGARETGVQEILAIGEVDGVPSFSELFGDELERQVPVSGNDLVALPYSSGTTGLSKGVMLTHRNLVANIQQFTSAAELTDADVVDAVLPFFHIYGMQVLMNCGLSVGVTIVLLARFDMLQFLGMHQKYGITRSFVAPPVVVALAKHPVVDSYDLSALQVIMCGAAPLSAELTAAAQARLGVEIVQGYGMTELSPVSHMTPLGRNCLGSAGVTAPSTESVIMDPVTGESLGVDHDGEVWVRGPQVMVGYLNNPTATAATIDADGWLHTGDIGHFDADGNLFIVDRLKELIKYKGFQVPPAELEALLLTHPAVADAAVVGLPDDESGEVPAAFVVLKADHTATGDEIVAFIAERVAYYKQIRRITFIDVVPKSASGKILRRELRATPS
jgi:acyl-CoA synthetase (AMP-forming)/AMP-acid ligase II